MKNILKIITLVVTVLFVTASCAYDDSNFDALTKGIEANSTYYVQFKNATKTLETSISLAGTPVEISTTIDVALLGAPLSTPLEINLAIDPSTTIAANMYTLSSTKITIPAGKTSGTITLTSVAEKMPLDVPLKFVLNIMQGEHNAPAGTKLTYTLKRANFCPWTVDAMVGTYTGTEYEGYDKTTMTGAKYTITKVSATQIQIAGLGQALYSNVWGEALTGGDKVILTYLPNGKFTAVNQYLSQTDGKWDYYFGASTLAMKWDGCTKKIELNWFFNFDNSYTDKKPFITKITKD